jgi:hypothetical protein
MERQISVLLENVRNYKQPEDITKVEEIISEYRLNALRQNGIVRKEIFEQAEQIDRALKVAIGGWF